MTVSYADADTATRAVVLIAAVIVAWSLLGEAVRRWRR